MPAPRLVANKLLERVSFERTNNNPASGPVQPELYSKLNALCSTFGTQASARAAVACCAASKVSPREMPSRPAQLGAQS